MVQSLPLLHRSLSLGLVSVLLLPEGGRAQDLLYLKGRKKPLRGSVVQLGDGQVRFNPFFSTHRDMVWGTEDFPGSKVRETRPDLPPREELWVRLAKHKGSAKELVELAGFCRKERLGQEAAIALEWALRADPEHEEALKAYGRLEGRRFVRGDPIANPALGSELSDWLEEQDGAERSAAAAAIRKKYGLSWSATYFARVVRSSKLAKGLTENRPLTMRGDTVKGVYTIYVPGSYNPFTAMPLLVGLHGGGRGGKDGNKVVGSGPSAMNFYRSSGERLGYIVVCPTAIRAPWSAAPNDALLQAVLDEVKALYNIDENRIDLTGHSMGGFGSWHFGPRYCELWAGIGPMSGGGSQGLARLRKTRTFVYLYHGADDNVVGPGDSRSAAKRMLSGGNDFVYTELPSSGHGLPRSIVDEMLRFFARKRRAVKKRAQARVLSSFAAKESRKEIKFFGRLLPARSSKGPGTKALLKTLANGGGSGERVAEQLGELGDAKLVPSLIRILRRKKNPADGRALAARVLGRLGSPKALEALGQAAREPQLRLYHEAVAAIGAIPDRRQGGLILGGIAGLCAYFESRMIGSSRMSYSDWDVILPEIAFGLAKLAGLEARDKAKRLASSVVKKVLLPEITVPVS
ncbi:MAG: HEAT repeat domain-containing protein, partial [Planctomycetota bacterium]